MIYFCAWSSILPSSLRQPSSSIPACYSFPCNWFQFLPHHLDLIWFGLIWLDLTWLDLTWLGSARLGSACLTWFDLISFHLIWFDLIWFDLIWIPVACNLLLPVAYMDHIVVNRNTCPTGEAMLTLLNRESEVPSWCLLNFYFLKIFLSLLPFYHVFHCVSQYFKWSSKSCENIELGQCIESGHRRSEVGESTAS